MTKTVELKDLVPGKRYYDNEGAAFAFLGHGRRSSAGDFDAIGIDIISELCGPFTPIIEKRTVEGWVNVYGKNDGGRFLGDIHPTEEMARHAAGKPPKSIDTVRITYEEPVE